MLHLVDQSLEALLRAEVPLPADQIDVSFEAPDRDWSARTTKPTLNLYLWDVRLSLKEQNSGVEAYRDEDGKLHRSAPKPRVDLRYLVTAWTADVRDEHQLLGAVLGSLYTHKGFPEQYLQGGLDKVLPLPKMIVAYPDERENGDFWNALGGRLKPGLDLIVTMTLDVALAHEVGPPVVRYEVGLKDTLDERVRSKGLLVGHPDTGAVARGDTKQGR